MITIEFGASENQTLDSNSLFIKEKSKMADIFINGQQREANKEIWEDDGERYAFEAFEVYTSAENVFLKNEDYTSISAFGEVAADGIESNKYRDIRGVSRNLEP